jgi:hypothetical protein
MVLVLLDLVQEQAGQALQTGGAGANPSWGDAVGGILQVKSSQTLTSAEISSLMLIFQD